MLSYEIFQHEEITIPLSQFSDKTVSDAIRSKTKEANLKLCLLGRKPQDLSDKNIFRALKTNTPNDCTHLDKFVISVIGYFSYTSNILKYHLLMNVFAILFIYVLTHPLGIESRHQESMFGISKVTSTRAVTIRILLTFCMIFFPFTRLNISHARKKKICLSVNKVSMLAKC